MTAPKLHTAGGVGEDAGAGAGGAARGGVQQQKQNGDGSSSAAAAAAGTVHVRSSNSTSHAARLASSIIQPLPLASRFVGGGGGGGSPAKQESMHPPSYSALGSTWIRRFLPSIPSDVAAGKLGPEVPDTPRGLREGGGGGGHGSQPIGGPLLLPPAPKDSKKQEVVLPQGRMAVDSSRESTAMGSGNVHYMHRGKAAQEWGHRHGTTTTTTTWHDLGENELPNSHQKGTTASSHPPKNNYVVGEESSRPPQQQQGKLSAGLSNCGDLLVNANTTPGVVVKGFGSLRVVIKPPTSNFKKVALSIPNLRPPVVAGSSPNMRAPVVAGSTPNLRAAVTGSSFNTRAPVVAGSTPNLRAPVTQGETSARTEVDIPPPVVTQPTDGNRLSNAVVPERKLTQVMAPQSVTKITPLQNTSDLPKDVDLPGRSSRAGEFAGSLGFSRAEPKETESDIGRPGMAQTGGVARETAMPFGGSKGVESSARYKPFGEDYFIYRPESWYNRFMDHEEVDRSLAGCKKPEERLVPSSYPPAKLRTKEEVAGQATESQHPIPAAAGHPIRAAGDGGARPSSGAGFSKGVETRTTKVTVVGGGFPDIRHTEAGSSHPHQQESQEPPHHAPHQFQGDTILCQEGKPLPFSPHSSFTGEESSGDETRNSRGKAIAEPSKCLLTAVSGAPKTYQDGLDDRAGQSDWQTPWTSLFTAFQGHKQPEPPNSTSTTSLPPRSKLHAEGPKANANHEESNGGGRGRTEVPLPASSGEVRSRFDNPSSHFSSSPWPDNESLHPNEDAGSCPYNSQGTASAYQSQGSRIANYTANDARGQHMSTYRYDTRDGREVSDAPGRRRDMSVSEAKHRQSTGIQGEDATGFHMQNDDQTHGSPNSHGHCTSQPNSGGQKYTSGSSPPPRPVGYANCSDLASPIFTRGIADEGTVQSRIHEADSEMRGSQVPRQQQSGYGNAAGGFYEGVWRGNRDSPKHNNNEAVYADYRDASALRGKDLEAQKAQPNAKDIYREAHGRTNEAGETGPRHGKLRISSEAIGEAGTSGPSKRSRHHLNLNLNSSDVAARTEVVGLSLREQVNGNNTGNPSSWLQRWLPQSNGKPLASFARPQNMPIGLTANLPSGTRNKSLPVFSSVGGTPVAVGEPASRKVRNGPKDVSSRLGVNRMPIPSAAAMALVSTAARETGPVSQQRKATFTKWPSVRLQASEGHRSA